MNQTRRLAAILAADAAGYSRLMGVTRGGEKQRTEDAFHGALSFGGGCRAQAFVCERRSHSGLVVDENHVLPDGLPADVQLICGEFWIGIANCQAAQDRQRVGRES
jgi:hypothetical protein